LCYPVKNKELTSVIKARQKGKKSQAKATPQEPEWAADMLVAIASDTQGEKAQDRIRALAEYIDLRGWGGKSSKDYDKMTNEELNEFGELVIKPLVLKELKTWLK
jgi:hypothetical protein